MTLSMTSPAKDHGHSDFHFGFLMLLRVSEVKQFDFGTAWSKSDTPQ